jgi:hypothetical protein
MMQDRAPNNTSQSSDRGIKRGRGTIELFDLPQQQKPPSKCKYEKRDRKRDNSQYLFPEFGKEKARIAEKKTVIAATAASGRAKRAFVQFPSV